MVLGKVDSYIQKNEMESLSYTINKTLTQNELKTWT